MPSGTMSTITMAPPGVFTTSMPPELSNSASPVLSSEERESVSSTESRRRRLGGGITNCTPPVTGSSSQTLSSYCASPTFVIESPKLDHSNEPFAKVRKKTRGHRNRGGGHNGNSPYSVNKPLKVTIRRTNAHSHTLNSSMQDGSVNRMSPSSVYSSVPGDDETSPIRVLSPHHHHHHNIPNSFSSSSKAVDYKVQDGAPRDASVSTMDRATSVEPDHLGPCEPGTKVSLTGSVWMETPGMLCVNVNWRGRSYVGTLMDFTKNGLNLACPSKMITSLSCLKNKISWNPVSASVGGNMGSLGTSGSVKTRSSNPGSTESRGRALTSARGRRKRRGYGQLPTSSSNNLVSDGMESNQEDEAPSSNNPQPEADSPIECPIEECGKRFPDFRCLQCHLQQSHRIQKKTKLEYKTEDSVNQEPEIPCTVPSPSAPQLAKAVSSSTDGVQLPESNSNDEDIPPPTLDRGPAVSEEQVPLSNDHPPTASPAYSDISDDAPATPKITVSKPTIDSNPPPPPPWQHPTIVPQKPSQPPQLVQNPPQSQPVDWSVNSRIPPAPSNPITTTTPHSHTSSVPPVRSSPYDFDPTTAAAIMTRLQGGQFPYGNIHPSTYQVGPHPHQTATPGVPFNIPRNPLAAADFSQAQLATFMAYQQELARRHQSELQRRGRSPQQQRHSPHLPPGIGSQQQFRPPP
nr:zinc finger protein 609 [Hymenolepis microstoma]